VFTGIVEEMGTIQKIERGSQSAVLSIRCEKVLEGTRVSDRDKPAK
jgi:riboflavin synthase